MFNEEAHKTVRKIRGVAFVRLNGVNDEGKNLVDGNTVVWKNIIEEFSYELRVEDGAVRKEHLIFQIAHNEKAAIDIFKKLYENGYDVIIASHGDPSDKQEDMKGLFGGRSSKREFISTVNKAIGAEFLSSATPWHSCDWTNGARTPNKIFSDDMSLRLKGTILNIAHGHRD